MKRVCLASLMVVFVAFAVSASSSGGDHHRNIRVFYDYQPKIEVDVAVLPSDRFVFYKTNPKAADSTYELEVNHADGTTSETTFPASFRYLVVSHDCALGCTPP